MATFAVTKNEQIIMAPFLIRKLTCTGGATSLAYTHGETYSPDMAFSRIKTETPTVTTVVIKDESATQVKLDTLGDAADDIEVYLVWFNQPGNAVGIQYGIRT